MKVEYFVPCYIDHYFPEIAEKGIKILKQFGYEVSYQSNNTCCGKPAFEAGKKEVCKEVSKHWLELNGSSKNEMVFLDHACKNNLDVSYPEMFSDSVMNLKMKQVQNHSFELLDFIAKHQELNQLKVKKLKNTGIFNTCERNKQNKSETYLELLKINGTEILEFNYGIGCCGFGGEFASNFKQLSIQIGKNALNQYLEVGIENLITNDILCYAHLNGIAKQNALPIDIHHIYQIIEL